MNSPKITYKYYSNPAFCAQSEVVYTQQSPCVSPRIVNSPSSKNVSSEHKRIPPLGANSPRKILPRQEYRNSTGNQRVKTDISDNPLRNIYAKSDGPLRYINQSQNSEIPPKPGPKPKKQLTPNNDRIKDNVMKNVGINYKHETMEMYCVNNIKTGDIDSNGEEETIINSRVLKHRYAEIPDDFDEYSPTKKRIIETEPEEYNVDQPSEDEYKEIPTEIVRSVNGKLHRYAIVPSDDEDEVILDYKHIENKIESPPTFHIRSPEMSRKNIEATQKLHEYLSTPKKELKKYGAGSPLKSCASSPSLRSQLNAHNGKIVSPTQNKIIAITPSKTMMSSTPKHKMTPSKSCVNIASPPLPRRNSALSSSFSPRAQQRLIYDENISPKKQSVPNFYVKEKLIDKTDFDRSYDMNNEDYKYNYDNKQQLFMARSTAVISPRLISIGNSPYRESMIGKTWKPTPGCATLMLAAAMLALCGGLTAALSFYMMYTFGRHYYLDIGVLSGFTCLILGLLGFRSHTNQLLPNRNYISGYIIMSIFSLLSCGILLTLLCLGPHWDNGRLETLVGGIVTTLGAFCLLLATVGTVSSYCCGHPPPDNRVADSREF